MYMNFIFPIPSKIKEFVEHAKLTEITIGCSDSQVFKIEKDNNIYFLKMMKKDKLVKEYQKLMWLSGKLNVPKVILFYQSDYDYLITEGMPGKMLCDEYYLKNYNLNILKDAFWAIYNVDSSNCPFDMSNSKLLLEARYNVENKIRTTDDLKQETKDRFKDIYNLLEYLEQNNYEENLIFSFGDISLTNLLAIDDKFVGFIDVGECGLADKWLDLAVCEKSIIRNYGKEYVDKFYELLGIVPDREKIDYHLLLLELI